MSELTDLPPQFASKVRLDNESGCWLWTANLNRNGYGMLYRPDRKRSGVAHRYAYESLVGAIPEGLKLDHLCRVRNCVNPAHLEPVTQRENLLRGETVNAKSAAVTHCPRGHAYEGDNLYVTRTGFRKCRTCHRDRMAAARARKSLALPFAGHPDYREEWKP